MHGDNVGERWKTNERRADGFDFWESLSKRNKKSSSSEVDVNVFADAKERWRIQAKDQTAWRRWIINQVEVDGFDPSVKMCFLRWLRMGRCGNLAPVFLTG